MQLGTHQHRPSDTYIDTQTDTSAHVDICQHRHSTETQTHTPEDIQTSTEAHKDMKTESYRHAQEHSKTHKHTVTHIDTHLGIYKDVCTSL